MQHPEVLREVSLVSFCDDDGDNDGDDDDYHPRVWGLTVYKLDPIIQEPIDEIMMEMEVNEDYFTKMMVSANFELYSPSTFCCQGLQFAINLKTA